MRLREIIGHFWETGSRYIYGAELGALLGLLLGIEYWIGRPRISALTLLKLNDGSPLAEQSTAGKRIADEPAYFLDILRCASAPRSGDTELMECFVCPVRGTKLFAPPHGVLRELSSLVSEERIKIRYYLIIEKGDLAHLDPKDIQSFMDQLSFADGISFIFVDAEIRERFGIRQRSLINRVTFTSQRIAFTHNRDHNGIFTSARQYSGRSAIRVFSVVERLRLLAVSRDAMELSNGFRGMLPRGVLKTKKDALVLGGELEADIECENREGC